MDTSYNQAERKDNKSLLIVLAVIIAAALAYIAYAVYRDNYYEPGAGSLSSTDNAAMPATTSR